MKLFGKKKMGLIAAHLSQHLFEHRAVELREL
jgi:hypothetical protein